MPRALLSVSDKIGITDFARSLAARGYELISTGGTARALTGAGLAVTSVSDLTGFPELMDGRVKTLHPAVHGGILARRDRSDDMAALERHGLGPIDIVVVNLYPFAKAAADPGTPFETLVEEIDIGGPSLVRAAAKNFRGVLVVVDPADYSRLLAALDATPSLAFRFDLARKAIAHTAAYDAEISRTLADVVLRGDRFERGSRAESRAFPDRLDLSLQKVRDLRYGENPHLPAALYVASGFSRMNSLANATILQGKELSYTNLLDLDSAARVVLEFDEPAAAVVKHMNPCGAAIGDNVVDAYTRARDADSQAAFGGIVAANRPIEAALADAITSTYIEAVVAPGVDHAARAILARKANMRVVVADFDRSVEDGMQIHSILGGVLVQECDRVVEARNPWTGEKLPEGMRVVSRRSPTPEEWDALRFAWRISAYVKSNAVVFTDRHRTLAIGAGQMSRVDAVRVALMKAHAADRSLSGSVAASDAFFPFRDGVDQVAEAGATAVIHPGGSVRDPEVIASADEHAVAMVFTGRRHFRH